MEVTGFILAGGLSRRMGGGYKSLKSLQNTTILQRVINRLEPQFNNLVLNINDNIDAFAPFNLPLVKDLTQDYAGPLAGILAGLKYIDKTSATHLVSIPSDSPFLPSNLVLKLMELQISEQADVVSVSSNNQNHPIIGLWPKQIADDLEKFLASGQGKIDKFTAQFKTHYVNFNHLPFDPFFNCNTPEDLIEAEQILLEYPSA